MIVGIGVDVLEVARMERELRRDPEGMRAELFTPGEIADCDRRHVPARHFAARFAAKEALLKALTPPARDQGSWREAEVRVGALGEPLLMLHGRLRAWADRRRVRRVFLSLSHLGEIAAATVVLEGEAPRTPEPT